MYGFFEVRKLANFRGDARLYENGDTGEKIIISRANTFDRGDETMIFAATPEGDVADWTDLYASYGETHEVALDNYERGLPGSSPGCPLVRTKCIH